MNHKRILFLIAALLLISSPLCAQSSQANRNSDIGKSSDSGLRYYTDEAGLKLLELGTPLDDYIDADTYLIGPQDVLSIYGSGGFEFAYRGLVVNASGDITMPIVGLVSLKGKTLAEVKKHIIEVFGENINDTEVFVTIDQPKPVGVHLGGDIPNPGKHVLPPATRFDFLITGYQTEATLITPLVDQEIEQDILANPARPSFTGVDFEKIEALNLKRYSNTVLFDELTGRYDLRNIRVVQSNGTVKYVDLFGYYKSGDKRFNPYLSSGDQIFISKLNEYSKQISIGGAVENPFNSSFRNSDTVSDLILISGGLLPQADTSKVLIRRQTGNEISTLEVNSEDFATFEVQPNDRVIAVYNESIPKSGAAWVYGEVTYPGIYSITNNQTSLREVLEVSGGLTSDALGRGAYIIKNPATNRGFTNEFDINRINRTSDQYLEGFDYLELESALDPNRFPVDLTNPATLDDVLLNNGDKLYIPTDNNQVIVFGQVNRPGYYSYDNSLRAEDYISKADGLTVAADENRVFIIKSGSLAWKKLEETSVESGDIIFADRVPFEDVTSIRSYQVQTANLRNNRVNLIISAISVIASTITTIVVIRNAN